MFTSAFETPIGLIVIRANDSAVVSISFKDAADDDPNAVTLNAKTQFQEYFAGRRLDFDFPMHQEGTAFQQRVWQELLKVPAGFPISYTSLSRNMNSPLAIRAIASANGKNNLMIAVPCHRIIGAKGDLVGYAGGLWRKKWLLEHEAKVTGIGQGVLF